MVDVHIAGRGIRNRRVLAAMRQVPREAFVDAGLEEFAYEDNPLPIAERQTISQPYIVALMIEAAEIGKDDRVLEVGAGSGYAAAVAAQLADQVCAIERHLSLVSQAAERIRKLGYSNIELRQGDGTLGWPDGGQFDVILVAAGGERIPPALKQQLKIGGRLVIPVGGPDEAQELIKLTKRSEDDFEEEHLGAVRFVPLVGGADRVDDRPRASSTRLAGAARGTGLPGLIAEAAEPLPAFENPAFGQFFDRYSDRRVVLLGEASHGTSEFYRARAAITRRLIEQHGFSIVAVEADWPDAAAVDRYVRDLPARKGETPFRRFPSWMWRNTDVAAFAGWMRSHNASQPAERRAAFYGLDIYNMAASIAAVLQYLDKVDPDAAAVALAAGAINLRAGGADRRLSEMRGSRHCPAPRLAATTPQLWGARPRQFPGCRPKCTTDRVRRTLLPNHVLWRCRVMESPRHSYVRDPGSCTRRTGSVSQGDRLGAQFPHRGRAAYRDGRLPR
jgi:protein-L-isoaspartate(D-aspartate) O-methyltransferase